MVLCGRAKHLRRPPVPTSISTVPHASYSLLPWVSLSTRRTLEPHEITLRAVGHTQSDTKGDSAGGVAPCGRPLHPAS